MHAMEIHSTQLTYDNKGKVSHTILFIEFYLSVLLSKPK